MNVLLLHIKKNTLPRHVLQSPELADAIVITEPGHVQTYGAGVEIRLVDDVRNVERVRDVVLELMARRRIDRVFMPFELAQTVGGYLRSYFGLPGLGFDVTNNFANKYVMKQRYVAAGLPTARFGIAYGLGDVPRVAAELGWPVIVKPTLGGGTMDIAVFDSEDQFVAFTDSPAAESIKALDVPLIVEQFLTLDGEYHCDGIVHGGRVRFAAVAKYLAPLLDCPQDRNGSYFLPAGHPVRVPLLNLHQRAVTALGLDSGVTHMEFFKTAEGFLAGEIACRPAGGGIPEAIRLGYGVDIWQACLDTALGRAPVLDVVEHDGLVVNYHLPVTSGRIVALSSAEELRSLPGVLRVDMIKKVGDIVPERYNSSYTTGVVFLSVSDEAAVDDAIQTVARHYRLEVA